MHAEKQTAKKQTEKPRTLPLTRREKQVLEMIALGKTSQQVAEGLRISKRTVDFHLENVYEKLRVTSRIQAIREALHFRIIALE